MKKKLSNLLPFLFLAASAGNATMNKSVPTSNAYKENNSPEAKGLHLYKCGKYEFFVHNDREALKRAKKRGYWTEKTVVVRV